MYQSTYFVDKSTATFADSLLAYGLATLLHNLLPERVDVRIKDEGVYYAINLYVNNLSEPIQPEWVENATYDHNGVKFILTDTIKKSLEKKGEEIPDTYIDYEEHRKRRAEYFEKRKTLPKAAQRPGASPDEFPELRNLTPPHRYWDIWAQVNQMSAISAYNKMVLAWAETRSCFPDVLKIILQLFSTTPNNIEKAVSNWKKLAKEKNLSGALKVTASQVFNPGAGKGTHATKSVWSAPGQLNSFWLLEYLKIIGMQHAGLPREINNPKKPKEKDRKTYVLLPKNIKLSTSNKVFEKFQKVLWANTAIKMDIIAALKYAQVFLEQWISGQITDEFEVFLGAQPGDHVQGMAMVYYKKMGKGMAVLNQSTINLPRWTEKVTTKKEAQQFIDILEEHERIIQGFKENRGLEYDMLYQYRSFLSSGELRDFFKFTGKYSSYLTQQYEKKEPHSPKQFSTKNLRRLIMAKNKPYKSILDNPGFQRIATAIRQSTVQAQYFRYQKNDKRYQIRYGLGQDLIRKGKYPQEFLKTLAEFLAKYTNENAMLEEQLARKHQGTIPNNIRKTMRPSVRTSDITEIAALIDEYDGDSELICNLLVAYGYASNYNPDNAKDSKTTETESE